MPEFLKKKVLGRPPKYLERKSLTLSLDRQQLDQLHILSIMTRNPKADIVQKAIAQYLRKNYGRALDRKQDVLALGILESSRRMADAYRKFRESEKGSQDRAENSVGERS